VHSIGLASGKQFPLELYYSSHELPRVQTDAGLLYARKRTQKLTVRAAEINQEMPPAVQRAILPRLVVYIVPSGRIKWHLESVDGGSYLRPAAPQSLGCSPRGHNRQPRARLVF
jgi:hypothetical protein